MSNHGKQPTPSKRNSTGSPKKPSPLPPPPKFHSTTERLPVLESAPPSASTSLASIENAVGAAAGTVVDLPPPPRMTGISTPNRDKGVSILASPPLVRISPPPQPPPLPPPPPPPPVRQEPVVSVKEQLHEETPSVVLHDEALAELTEPEKLPKIFSPTSSSSLPPPLLARRQSHVPILVIATEAAHKLAWKNHLRLTDLLGGLSNTLGNGKGDETTNSMPLPPFRSVNRSMLLHWDTLKVDFMEPSDYESASQDDAINDVDVSFVDQYARLLPTEEGIDALQEQVQQFLNTAGAMPSSDGSDTHEDDDSFSKMETCRHHSLAQVSEAAFALTSKPDAPWLVRYKSALDVSTDFLPHDLLLQAPPLVLLVCSSNDFAPPVECLRELSSPHFLPRQFHNGTWDKTVLRAEALVLHDVVDGGTSLDEVSLKQTLVQHFGGGASILRINSILPEAAARMAQPQAREDNGALSMSLSSSIWGDDSQRGCCLSANDRLVLQRYLATLITSSLLPSLERRISDLNYIVTDRKKGVKNVFKSLWRKPKDEVTPPPPSNSKKTIDVSTVVPENSTETSKSTVNYRFDSIESQVRLLADTLFLVRDWDAALGMYRLIKDDYKADKAMLEYGSVHEMMALATYMLDPVGRSQEAFSYMETALFSYTRAAEEDRPSGLPSSRPTQALPATRLATRLCLVMAAATHVVQDRPLEVADLLASASSHETPLGAAVLLEQSSAHYYRAGMYRKYAFHMLMSGHMFRSAMQEHHAFRCFTSALYIYHDGRWDELHNHLKSALAAQLYSLGRMSVSVELYAKLVGTHSGGRVSQKSQQKFLQHLQEICQNNMEQAMVGADRMAIEDHTKRLERIDHVLHTTAGATRVLELPNMNLPSVDDSSVTVSVESEQVHRDIPSFGNLGKGDDSVWQELRIQADAELKALDSSFTVGDSPTLANIEDPLTRRVVAAIDKEKGRINLMAKAKRSGNQKDSPVIRARMEPLLVHCVMENPLSVPIHVEDLQLVAKMTEADSKRFCTNEDAIRIGANSNDQRPWVFSGVVYESPEFCRISGPNSGVWKSLIEEAPFFVVTKSALTLEPGNSLKVSLGVCPLVLGDMEVLGVRFRLFGDVWVYHPFHIKGPLLQNTSENRASRARAESLLLKSKIEQDMPRVNVTLIQNRGNGVGEGPMLVGQMSSWTLRLTNSGTAPAAHVFLKTNLPWITVDSAHEPLLAGDPSPHCSGPSGTLTSLPLDDPSLKRSGVLQPGESVDIPILIRASDGGNHTLYMLYRYELWDPSLPTPKRRWLQNMFNVPASPSLTVTASLMPSFWKQHEYVLSVEMTNYRSDKSSELDVTLDRLCILSRHYRMELLQGQLGEIKTDASPFRLGWQERVTLHYRVIPLDSPSAACMLSECQFAEGQVDVTECLTGPTTNYLCMEYAQQEFQNVLKMHEIELARVAAAEESGGHPRSIAQIRRAKSSLSGVDSIADTEDEPSVDGATSYEVESHPTSIGKLCPPDSRKAKLHMVCTWSAVGSDMRTDIVHGQHHFTRLSVRPTTNTRGCPITITCKHPSHVSHEFDKGPLAIPFEITLRNRLVDAGVFFEFSLQRPRGFDFIGTEAFQWALEGGEELTVPIQAVVPKAGVYNLQSVRLTVTKAEKKVPYLFPLQWILKVNA